MIHRCLTRPPIALVVLLCGMTQGVGLGVGVDSAAARSRVVLGGSATSGYIYGEADGKNALLAEGGCAREQGGQCVEFIEHDARFELAGMLGLSLARAADAFTLGLYAGGLLTTRFNQFSGAVIRLDSAYTVRFDRLARLTAGLNVDLSPVSASQQRGREVNEQTVGRHAITLRPTTEAALELSHHDELAALLNAQIYTLVTRGDLAPGEITLTYGLQGEVVWRHSLTRLHRLSLHALGRLMGSSITTFINPVSGIVGGLAGYALTVSERLSLGLQAGVVAVVGLTGTVDQGGFDYLAPVEPIFRGSLSFNLDRHDTIQLEAGYLIEENQFGGLPQRLVSLQAVYDRAPGWHRVRWRTELAYQYNRAAGPQISQQRNPQGQVVSESTALFAEDIHSVLARLRLFWSFAQRWRATADANFTLAFASTTSPISTPDQAVRGWNFQLLLGVAYVFAERPQDEGLLADVW